MSRTLWVFCGLAALGSGIFLDTRIYMEFFSDGPPYYDRSTNMDKWEDPMPWLLPVNGALLVFLAYVARRARRR